MSKYEINIGSSVLSIPNVRTSTTTLNTLVSINTVTAGVSYPFQIINSDTTVGNITVLGLGKAPTANGNAEAAFISYKYDGFLAATNSASFGLSGAAQPALTLTNNATASLINCTTLDITPLTLGRKVSLYGTIANTTTFLYEGLGIDSNAIVYNTGSTTNSHIFYAATSSVARTELFRVAGTGVVSIPATGSLSLGTPLGTTSGGTGLATVGTAGQYLASNGTTLNWVNPSAGTGSVTSVSLAVDSSLSGLFTNTGTGTITTTGAFTLTQAATPTITVATANSFTVTKSSGSSTIPAYTINGGSGASTLVQDTLATVSLGGDLFSRFGRATTAGNFATMRYVYVNTNSASNTFAITLDGGGELKLRRSSITTTVDLAVTGALSSTTGLTTTTVTLRGSYH